MTAPFSHGEGPFDPDELVQWAEKYGHPEEWAKRAQAAHARAEALEAERDVFRQALADIYTGRISDEPLCDDGMVLRAIDERVHRALFVDTTPPPEGYPR